MTGYSYIVDEKRPELFIPETDGRIESSISQVGNSNREVVELMRVVIMALGTVTDGMKQFTQKFLAVPPEYVLAAGDANNPGILANSIKGRTASDPKLNASLKQNQGGNVNW